MADSQVYYPITANDSTPKMTPGQVWTTPNGNMYKYVLVEDMALAANDVVEYSDVTGAEVTQDRAGGSSLGRAFAGVAQGTITDAYYGVVQIKGVATVKVPASIAISAGQALVNSPTADGGVNAATTATRAFAWGMALSSETTSAATTVTAVIF